MIFRSDLKVECLSVSGSDATIAEDALVSSRLDPMRYTEKRLAGLINSLMRQKHGSPFESGYMRFLIDAPRAVRDEHVRHRIGSYSSTSLRYRMAEEMEVYIPPAHRPLKPGPEHRAMRPEYIPFNKWEYDEYAEHMQKVYGAIAQGDEQLLWRGFTATEARRWTMPDGLYTPYIYRANPRMIMAFLALRTHNEQANHISYPMWEIEQVANQIEALFMLQFPLTHAAFNQFGREAP